MFLLACVKRAAVGKGHGLGPNLARNQIRRQASTEGCVRVGGGVVPRSTPYFLHQRNCVCLQDLRRGVGGSGVVRSGDRRHARHGVRARCLCVGGTRTSPCGSRRSSATRLHSPPRGTAHHLRSPWSSRVASAVRQPGEGARRVRLKRRLCGLTADRGGRGAAPRTRGGGGGASAWSLKILAGAKRRMLSADSASSVLSQPLIAPRETCPCPGGAPLRRSWGDARGVAANLKERGREHGAARACARACFKLFQVTESLAVHS